MLTDEQVDRLIREFRDPALGRALTPREDWRYHEDAYRRTLKYLPSGCGVIRQSEQLRWYPRDRFQGPLRGPRGGFRDFRYPSRAIRILVEGGYLAAGAGR